MTSLPNELRPVDELEFLLPSKRSVTIPRARPVFRRWPGTAVVAGGGEETIDSEGRPASVGQAVLWAFRKAGWEGVLLDPAGLVSSTAPNDGLTVEKLPETAQLALDRVRAATAARTSVWEVFCWRDALVIFAKTKRLRREQFRGPELSWLEAGLMSGLTQDSFLVVEWDLQGTD